MLHEFLTLHRIELMERCKLKAALRFAPRKAAIPPDGVPLILDQLIETLRAEYVTAMPNNMQIGESAPSKPRPLRTGQGLPAGDAEEMFRPGTQKGHDKIGL
ncbi:MAG TPA: hypothetical protein VFY27_10255, partial [Woeseiaceae bacterium]|nr:hypothetical protein [Woeseiaceae bacterium]